VGDGSGVPTTKVSPLRLKRRLASTLGKFARGVPKSYSPAEIAKRTARLRKAQKSRAKTQRALRRANDKLRDGAPETPPAN